ncbi:MAG: hypothetical protein HYY32_00335, partial [Chloroflexi bacterium]|nr:hypothetical protein [Chloroflexota bacterium]
GDMARAKQILGNHCGLIGGIPPALLKIASPQEVDDFCKDLIKTCGKGGGFMLGCNSSADDAKPANVRAMIDAVKKHGRY